MTRFLSAKPDARLLPLPWSTPLADWPTDRLVALPRGISRHVVRFIKVDDSVYAAKEVVEHLAIHEYRLLHDLKRLGTPSVEPIGVVTGRTDSVGEPLDPVLITRHLKFSLPYRSLFHTGVRQGTVMRLLDALVVLLVRLHLVGFLWGDVSLSNVLFRRDAEAFAAYLVDAETGELHDALTDGQREHDLQIARTNMFGEFLDLEEGDMLDSSLDPLNLVTTIESRYRELWNELTGVEEYAGSDLSQVESRVRRLNALGFDVAELDIETSPDGSTLRIQPKVVDAGHHQRRLMRLTGLDVEENQARRLLNDLDTFRARKGLQHADEAVVAHMWLTECFEPVIAQIPPELARKRELAQFFHEVLDYRWYQSQRENREVSHVEAAKGYVRDVLAKLPDEAMSAESVVPVEGESIADQAVHQMVNPYDPSLGYVEDQEDEPPYDPWEDAAPADDAPQVLDMAALLRAKAKK
ncbi:DUF4032 domain-containing protein [Acidipropionibacterium acidipropionici]|uniref:DUF4032 domain-containing protein n=1 Tax=Acidipropionibacterium acidipropionici TaxID=1748 RepID=UPI00110B2F6F|nr:DUF4032 domain-containing protein [Acidipropionibacterium acidipropionici]QCV95788.1 DUF4032 domain-containing protein [Acidipropionibacterium acidipropionici]